MQRDYNLKDLNAFHIAVIAKHFAEISTADELATLLRNPEMSKLPKYILGEGSSTLFTRDFEGLVLKNNCLGRQIVTKGNEQVTIKVGAGEIWDEIVKFTIDQGWGGIENMSYIPGTVGGAVVQNIAAYGQNFENVFVELTAVDLTTGQTKVFTKSECGFAYRDSVFKSKLEDKYCILDVTIQLFTNYELNESYYSRYGSVEQELAKSAKKPYTLTDIRTAVGNIRSTKFPNWHEFGNTGSFFKNPIVNSTKLQSLQKLYPNIQYYPVDQLRYEKPGQINSTANVKIAAGWLLEELGWRGKRIGNIGTSPNQAMVIVAYADVTAREVLDFAAKMQADFKDKVGIDLEPEVNIVD